MGIMRLSAFAGAMALLATQASAWGDMYMGDGTHNPNSMAPQAYHGPNYCPAGLAPVVIGGVICCGTPAQQVVVQQPKGYYNHGQSYGQSQQYQIYPSN